MNLSSSLTCVSPVSREEQYMEQTLLSANAVAAQLRDEENKMTKEKE